MSKPLNNVLKIVGVGALCALTFCFGRYDLSLIKDGVIFSYKEQRNCMIDEAIILEDIMNDIYEQDSTYFHNIIENNPNYGRLIDHYNQWEGRDEWVWEDMYNL